MTRETLAAKAGRLLADGRVHITAAGRYHVRALVDGSTGRYLVQYEANAWSCSCPSFRRCSHWTAVELVTDPLGRWSTP